jgi:hypothetical protein
MTLKKRGLGRGLEALLADDSAKEEQYRQQIRKTEEGKDAAIWTTPEAVTGKAEDRSAMVVALFKNIQRENRILLEEAESLRQLIAEFELLVRAEL